MATRPSTFITIIDTTSVAAGQDVFAAIQSGEAAFLNCLSAEDQFALLGYAAEPAPIYPASGVTPATAEHVAKATEALMAIAPAGDAADVAAALVRAVPLIVRGATPLLVGRNEATPAISSAADRPGRPSAAPISTLGTGAHPPAAVLRAVSAATGGTYRGIIDAAGIETYFFKKIDQTGTVAFEAKRNLSVSPLIGSAPTPGGFLLAVLWSATGAGPDLPFTIDLVQPNEEPWPDPPTYAAGSYVIYNLPDAEKGEWSFTFKQKDDAPAATVQVMALIR